MAKVKGSDITGLRKLFKERGAEVEDAFRHQLSPEQQSLYTGLLATEWVLLEDWLQLLRSAVGFLLPKDPEPWVSLGKALARKSYTGVYRIFLRIPSVKYVVSRAATIWSTYYDTGTVSTTSPEPKHLELVVEDFPALPFEFREAARGHIMVLLELTGARTHRVDPDYTNSSAWRWTIEWQ